MRSRISIATRRLVTLVGPGGAGKTRLALEVGERVRSDFADGVWLVEFAPVRSGSDVIAAVAAAVGLDDSDRLERYVAERRMLLLFDNCEHVIDDAATVAASLLRAGPGVTVLATSRERLGATGEMLYPLQSLEADEATDLFVERARAGGLPADALDQRDAIARICDQLDRMPLALELAAARTRSLSLDEIVERVEAPLRAADRRRSHRSCSAPITAECCRLELRAFVQCRATRLSTCVDLRRRIRSACRRVGVRQ